MEKIGREGLKREGGRVRREREREGEEREHEERGSREGIGGKGRRYGVNKQRNIPCDTHQCSHTCKYCDVEAVLDTSLIYIFFS